MAGARAGFIDAHVHPDGPETLDLLATHGVTTALDMATLRPELVASLRGLPDTATMRSAGTPIIGSAGLQAWVPGMAALAVIHGPEEAEAMAAQRIADGSDDWRRRGKALNAATMLPAISGLRIGARSHPACALISYCSTGTLSPTSAQPE
ncbi:hypothetical protein [Nocardia sp. NPDC050710]|uniref:hypothetical protein n=1 Tax=Nocardia sp. NPDC050710 TaxID=3157220 RepID=UPI0033E97F81